MVEQRCPGRKGSLQRKHNPLSLRPYRSMSAKELLGAIVVTEGDDALVGDDLASPHDVVLPFASCVE